MSIKIDTARLLEQATKSDWGYSCAITLLELAGLRTPDQPPFGLPSDDELRAIPDAIDYASLRAYTGKAALDIAESVAGADPIKHGGRLLLALAHEFFVPEIPKDHPGYLESLRLLRTVQAYLDGKATAEVYMAAAYHYRTRFCSTFMNRQVDKDFVDLFDAMPACGLEDVIALGGWGLSGQWECFGRFLARRRPEVAALEALRERVPETLFVDIEDDEDGLDAQAEEAAQAMIDEEITHYRDDMLKPLDARLAAVVDAALGYTPAA